MAADNFGGGMITRSLHAFKEITSPFGCMTKVVCTLGPSTDSKEMIDKLVAHGMTVARLNFSHAGNDYTYPKKLIELVRNAPGRHDLLSDGAIHDGTTTPRPKNVRAILVDTKGPEIRTGVLQGNVEIANIASGAIVEITTDDVSSDTPPSSDDGPHRIQVDYQSIASTMDIGSKILLDDGLIELEVTDIDQSTNTVTTVALNGGPIKKNKGVNLPNTAIDLPALTEKDKRDLKWSCENGADYVAASFIRTGANVRSVVAYLERCVETLQDENPGQKFMRPLVISKIENKEGLDNFDEILQESDGIMVARGDLGVEIPFREVFAAQKMMVERCNQMGKPVIVATQMLDSMQKNPRPTRAEVTDVGTACLDGADAVMLSGETAAGKYPLEAIKAMKGVLSESEDIKQSKKDVYFHDRNIITSSSNYLEEEMNVIAESTVRTALEMDVKAIIVLSLTGKTARAVAMYKPSVPVLAFCTDIQVARRLQLHRSVKPVLFHSCMSTKSDDTWRMATLRGEAVRTAKEIGYIRNGDRVIFMDRSKGKENDMFEYSHNIKLSTIQSGK
jgi:pyruvate kinase